MGYFMWAFVSIQNSFFIFLFILFIYLVFHGSHHRPLYSNLWSHVSNGMIWNKKLSHYSRPYCIYFCYRCVRKHFIFYKFFSLTEPKLCKNRKLLVTTSIQSIKSLQHSFCPLLDNLAEGFWWETNQHHLFVSYCLYIIIVFLRGSKICTT